VESVLTAAAELRLQVFRGDLTLEATSGAFREESFFMDVDEHGGVVVLEVGPESLPPFDVGVAGGDGALHS